MTGPDDAGKGWVRSQDDARAGAEVGGIHGRLERGLDGGARVGRDGDVRAEELAPVLERLGCPAGKSVEMASQLLKRSDQLMAERGWSREEALAHLVKLLRGGWAARERGFEP